MRRIKVEIDRVSTNGIEKQTAAQVIRALEAELRNALLRPEVQTSRIVSRTTPVATIRPATLQAGPHGAKKHGEHIAKSIAGLISKGSQGT